jgi:hypothetical protein
MFALQDATLYTWHKPEKSRNAVFSVASLPNDLIQLQSLQPQCVWLQPYMVYRQTFNR